MCKAGGVFALPAQLMLHIIAETTSAINQLCVNHMLFFIGFYKLS
jgi:hypothetical protein